MSFTMLAPVVPAGLVIPRHWNGPRRHGNGGYSAGVFASGRGPAARVVLRRPVPLERELRIVDDGPTALVLAGRRLVAEVTALPFTSVLFPPLRPTVDEADEAAARHPWTHVRHALSQCGVCSPHRRDGLGVTPGTLARDPSLVAAPFHTDWRLAHPDRPDVVRPEFVWAALDCPSFPAADLVAGRVRLLGTTAVARHREVYVGESFAVVGWTLGAGDRSVRTASALVDADGAVVASAQNVWVAPRRRS